MEGLRPERSFMSLKNPLRALLYSIFLASPNLPEAEITVLAELGKFSIYISIVTSIFMY
jgi:hypothetical protein